METAATVELRYNEWPREWKNMFAIRSFRYIEILFHIIYDYWSKENRSLHRELCSIEVRYIEFHLY